MNLICSLGAYHDGGTEAKDCPASNNNIMTEVSGIFRKMILTFSSCSISAFKQTILNKYDQSFIIFHLLN